MSHLDTPWSSEANSTSEYYEGHDLEALVDMPRYYRWILGSFGPHLNGRVLEVGAGTGNFSDHYLSAVDQATLLEPANNLFPLLAARFAQRAKVATINAPLEDWMARDKEAREQSFHTAVMVNVLEHIEDDYGTIERIGRLLRPGGHLLLFVPAKSWLYGSLDVAFHHYRRYSQSRLRRVIRRAGLQLIQLRYFDVLGMLPWFLAGRLFRKSGISPGAARLYDRWGVPLTSTLERWWRPPVGKNLLCIATRPLQASQALPRAA